MGCAVIGSVPKKGVYTTYTSPHVPQGVYTTYTSPVVPSVAVLTARWEWGGGGGGGGNGG